MLKKHHLFIFLALTLVLSACSDSKSKAQNDKPVQSSQEAKPQSDPNTVNAQGTVATIQPAPQSQPPQVVAAPVQNPQPAPAISPEKAPKIVLPVKKMSYGPQPKEKTIFRSFTIKNAGKSPLNIESVSPSCSCTTVDFPKVIQAGKSGVIKFKVETGAAPGLREKSITVKTNDPNEPTVSFEFSFLVKDK